MSCRAATYGPGTDRLRDGSSRFLRRAGAVSARRKRWPGYGALRVAASRKKFRAGAAQRKKAAAVRRRCLPARRADGPRLRNGAVVVRKQSETRQPHPEPSSGLPAWVQPCITPFPDRLAGTTARKARGHIRNIVKYADSLHWRNIWFEPPLATVPLDGGGYNHRKGGWTVVMLLRA